MSHRHSSNEFMIVAVARAIAIEVTSKISSDQGEISEAVENLVSHRFVGSPQLIVDRPAIRIEEDEVLAGYALSVTSTLKSGDFRLQHKRPCEGDFPNECFGSDFNRQVLRRNRRTVAVIKLVGDGQPMTIHRPCHQFRVVRLISDPHWQAERNTLAQLVLFLDASRKQQLTQLAAGAVESGQLRTVDLDEAVVDVQSRQRRHHMFDHLDLYAVSGDHRPSMTGRHVFDACRDRRRIGDVRALKHDSMIRRCRPKVDADIKPVKQADPLRFHRSPKRALRAEPHIADFHARADYLFWFATRGAFVRDDALLCAISY